MMSPFTIYYVRVQTSWGTVPVLLVTEEGNVLFNDTLNTFYLVTCCQITDKGPQWQKEGNVLFNDTLNTFYLVTQCQITGKGPLSDRRKEVLFNDTLNTFYLVTQCQITATTSWAFVSNEIFYMHHPTNRILHPQPLCHQSWSTG